MCAIFRKLMGRQSAQEAKMPGKSFSTNGLYTARGVWELEDSQVSSRTFISLWSIIYILDWYEF